MTKQHVKIPNWSNEAETIMRERFGKNNVIAPATVAEGKPWGRSVNAYYEDGAFYAITYAPSNKNAADVRSHMFSVFTT